MGAVVLAHVAFSGRLAAARLLLDERSLIFEKSIKNSQSLKLSFTQGVEIPTTVHYGRTFTEKVI